MKNKRIRKLRYFAARVQLFTVRRYYAGAVYAVSVYLSVTRRYCVKTAKLRITQSTTHDIAQ